MSSTFNFKLHRNAFGKLILTNEEGAEFEATPVRAFPIAAPDEGIALVDPHGHELAWIESLDDLPNDLAPLVKEELASREFMPTIESILSVSSFATPSTWHVKTSRGETDLILKGEEDIRRLASPALLIADSNGIQYLLRDRFSLDPHSKKLLDRFL